MSEFTKGGIIIAVVFLIWYGYYTYSNKEIEEEEVKTEETVSVKKIDSENIVEKFSSIGIELKLVKVGNTELYQLPVKEGQDKMYVDKHGQIYSVPPVTEGDTK